MSPFSRTNRRAFVYEEDPAFAKRFGTAQDNKNVDDLEERQSAQLDVREFIFSAALEIRNLPGESREKSLALTKLEEALMWAGKHIFTFNTPEPEDGPVAVEDPSFIHDATDYPWANNS